MQRNTNEPSGRMNIVKIFAALLTVAGMLLLIFSCLVIMRIVQLETSVSTVAAPALLGIIFFAGGIYLFKFMVIGDKGK